METAQSQPILLKTAVLALAAQDDGKLHLGRSTQKQVDVTASSLFIWYCSDVFKRLFQAF